MAQLLRLPDGELIKIDRSFYDTGRPPRMGLVGGRTIELDGGTPPMPEILQQGANFFYRDMRAVNNPDDVQHLPRPYRDPDLLRLQLPRAAAR